MVNFVPQYLCKKLATVSLLVFITEQRQDSVGLLANVIERPFTIVQNNCYNGTEYLEHIPHGYFISQFPSLIRKLNI